jgi:hypothetical protein
MHSNAWLVASGWLRQTLLRHLQAGCGAHAAYRGVPKCFTLWQESMCMRSKAWLTASVWLRRSRRLRDTLAAAPGLLAHASVTEIVVFCPMGPNLRYTAVPARLWLRAFSFTLRSQAQQQSTHYCDKIRSRKYFLWCAQHRLRSASLATRPMMHPQSCHQTSSCWSKQKSCWNLVFNARAGSRKRSCLVHPQRLTGGSSCFAFGALCCLVCACVGVRVCPC